MKHFSALVVAAVLIPLAAARPAGAQDPPAQAAPAPSAASTQASPPPAPAAGVPVRGAIFLGAFSNDNTGDLTRVGAYDVARQGSLPQFGAQFWGQQGGVRFDASAFNGGNARDQRYAAHINVNRHVRASVTYDRFQHRTQHDPLDYMDSAVGTFVIRHDDTDPGARYSSAHGTLDARLDVATPGLEALRFFVSHHRDARDGHRQALTTSHCSNCHTTAFTRGLDESTRDLAAGASFRRSGLTIEGSVSRLDFEDRAATPTTLYDKAVHPQTLADVFLNRVSYDARSGELPYDSVPRSRKDTQKLRARVELPREAAVTGSYTHSRTTNRNLDIASEFSGGTGRLFVPLGQRASLTANLRRYSIEADDVYVDVGEPVAPAGPSAGLTYAQAYPELGVVDYVRRSTLARTPTEGSLQLDARPTRRSSIRAQYAFEQIDRAFSEVEKTTTNRLLLSGRARPAKSLNLRFRVEQAWTRDPFTNTEAAVPTAYQLVPSPGMLPFGGQQYFTMYDSRSASLTSLPTRSFLADEGLTWSPVERVSLSAHYRMRKATNRSLTHGDWEHTVHMPGAEVWLAPSERVMVTAGYGLQRERTETLFTTLAFVG